MASGAPSTSSLARGRRASACSRRTARSGADFDRHDTAFLQALAIPSPPRWRATGGGQRPVQGEAFLRSVLEASPDCVKVLDTDGTVLSVSANGACALGLGDPLAVVGRSWTALWPEVEAAKVGRAVAEARSGRTARFKAFRPTAQGAPRWWDVVVAPVLGAAGEPPTRLVSVSRDVTERVEAAAAKDLLVAEVPSPREELAAVGSEPARPAGARRR